MTLNTAQPAMVGISVPGISVSLIEVSDTVLTVSLLDGYQLGKFTFVDSAATTLTFTAPADCTAYISGTVINVSAGQPNTVELDLSAFVYDEESGNYGVYIITDKAVDISSDVAFSVVKGAGNG